MIDSLVALSETTTLLATVPQPTPEAPPGSDGFLTVLNWIFWLVLLAAVAGFLIQIGMLIYNAIRGNAIQGFVGILICVVAAILAGSAVAILNIFI
ncbi:MAG: hypothetical protein L0K12_00850 [Brevibacterium aurantiacum]|uniref:hypothetical protein n=1 Tax=Brachybacterium alimentarium TaxID=47845 RepID=UPI000DF4BB9D|nr:hypothetical protein [Brachybacterium alimentarium]MDN6303065.1 hypothetical protein [Brachybacterium sp.]MDN6371469.1 hypothetical protein [Brevibacterium aurantiacum]RCS68764.1 hypothetical protein CIK68_12505 [Brachybacterium alimentarium]